MGNAADATGSTPYDDVFRTLVNDCRQLVIPVINEVFGENYTGSEIIEFLPNEHFLNQQDGQEDKRITDTTFKIAAAVYGNYDDACPAGNGTAAGKQKTYHLECESTPDRKILIRIFEYDAQIALDYESCIDGNELRLSFPHSAVLFLRSNRNTPDIMRVTVETPGGNVSYGIPALKIANYTLDKIFEKKLFFLIPFYIFSYERRFGEIDGDKQKLDALKAEFLDIRERLEKLAEKNLESEDRYGYIDEYTKRTLIEMCAKVIGHIALKFENIREGVGSVMRGQILDYEAKRIRNEGILIGEQIGEKRGEKHGEKRGKIMGTVDTYREDFGYDDYTIIERIRKRYNLSESEAREYV